MEENSNLNKLEIGDLGHNNEEQEPDVDVDGGEAQATAPPKACHNCGTTTHKRIFKRQKIDKDKYLRDPCYIYQEKNGIPRPEKLFGREGYTRTVKASFNMPRDSKSPVRKRSRTGEPETGLEAAMKTTNLDNEEPAPEVATKTTKKDKSKPAPKAAPKATNSDNKEPASEASTKTTKKDKAKPAPKAAMKTPTKNKKEPAPKVSAKATNKDKSKPTPKVAIKTSTKDKFEAAYKAERMKLAKEDPESESEPEKEPPHPLECDDYLIDRNREIDSPPKRFVPLTPMHYKYTSVLEMKHAMELWKRDLYRAHGKAGISFHYETQASKQIHILTKNLANPLLADFVKEEMLIESLKKPGMPTREHTVAESLGEPSESVKKALEAIKERNKERDEERGEWDRDWFLRRHLEMAKEYKWFTEVVGDVDTPDFGSYYL